MRGGCQSSGFDFLRSEIGTTLFYHSDKVRDVELGSPMSAEQPGGTTQRARGAIRADGHGEVL